MRILRVLLCLSAAVTCARAQSYSGPLPPKSDLPYLKHASSLVATEALVASEEKGKKDEVTYVTPGAASSVRTPLASPIFILKEDKLPAGRFALYKLDSRNGRREIVFAPKKQPKPFRLDLTRLNDQHLVRLEVQDSLEPGEYALTPEGSNQVFCFQVF